MNLSSDLERNSATRFKNFDDAADSILRLISKQMGINTLFIAKNDQQTNNIVKALNKEYTLLEPGDSLPFEETFCKISVDHGNQLLFIPDITQSELTRSLNVTKNLGSGSFIGIPIYHEDGRNYGTICGLDTIPFEITDRHVELFNTMSSLLSYVLELDEANKQIDNLSAPLVPIAEGVAILPIIGHINLSRVDSILDLALAKSQDLLLDFIIIDLSGITKINEEIIGSLLKIVKLLKLLGVEPILTGIRPEVAMQAIQSQVDLQDLHMEASLMSALTYLGFTLNKSAR